MVYGGHRGGDGERVDDFDDDAGGYGAGDAPIWRWE